MLLGLFLKPLGLGVELNLALNGAISSRDHRTKSATSTKNTGFPRGFQVFSVRIRYVT